ncbi:MAG: hypothetical protein P4M11_02875 [Candidatus Pacebacteria bacterium]|nr:hypothetical protein [Candidatus Paceibacterota bacterium]
MAYDEFLSIFTDCNLLSDTFTERDVIGSFAQSMMTQVDELDNSRHMKMQMVEFLEAFARAADVASLPPPDVDVDNVLFSCGIITNGSRRRSGRRKGGRHSCLERRSTI